MREEKRKSKEKELAAKKEAKKIKEANKKRKQSSVPYKHCPKLYIIKEMYTNVLHLILLMNRTLVKMK